MSKKKKDAEVILEQPLMTMRVVETSKGLFNIEIAMLEGPSISIEEPNELQAQTITQGLLAGYKSELTRVQEHMRDTISQLADEAKQMREA